MRCRYGETQTAGTIGAPLITEDSPLMASLLVIGWASREQSEVRKVRAPIQGGEHH